MAEKIVANVFYKGVQQGSGLLNINDTSIDPTITLDGWYQVSGRAVPGTRSDKAYVDAFFCGGTYKLRVRTTGLAVGRTLSMVFDDSANGPTSTATVDSSGVAIFTVTLGYHNGNFVDANYNVTYNGKAYARGSIAIWFRSDTSKVGYGWTGLSTYVDRTFIMMHPGEAIEIELVGGGGSGAVGGGDPAMYADGIYGTSVQAEVDLTGNSLAIVAAAYSGLGGKKGFESSSRGIGGFGYVGVSGGNFVGSYQDLFDITVEPIAMVSGNDATSGSTTPSAYRGNNYNAGDIATHAGYGGAGGVPHSDPYSTAVGWAGGSGAYVKFRLKYNLKAAAKDVVLGPVMVSFKNQADSGVTSTQVLGGAANPFANNAPGMSGLISFTSATKM